jgi:hypothetical protein
MGEQNATMSRWKSVFLNDVDVTIGRRGGVETVSCAAANQRRQASTKSLHVVQ